MSESLAVESKKLDVPPLEELVEVLHKGLLENFAHVQVGIVNCPDLSAPPFHLASSGIISFYYSQNSLIVDIICEVLGF